MMAEHIVSRIVIERFLTEDGDDLVRVDSELPVVEALGLLQLAIFDVCNRPADDDPDGEL